MIAVTDGLKGIGEAQEGVIRFDGIDIREIDLPHLRRNIGAVLQDSFLLRGSVRENIAVTKPWASMQEVVHRLSHRLTTLVQSDRIVVFPS